MWVGGGSVTLAPVVLISTHSPSGMAGLPLTNGKPCGRQSIHSPLIAVEKIPMNRPAASVHTPTQEFLWIAKRMPGLASSIARASALAVIGVYLVSTVIASAPLLTLIDGGEQADLCP